MMKKLLFPAFLGLAVGASGAWLAACAADGASDGNGGAGGGGATTGTGKSDASVDVAPDSEQPPGPITYEELCGDGTCVPGVASRPCEPNTSSTGTGGTTTAGGGGGGLGGAGGSGGAGGEAPLAYGCQVDVSGNEPASVCAPVSPGVSLGATCVSSAGCPAGAGCAAGETSAQCLAYCCEDLDCPTEHFCTPMPAAENPELEIPVCKKADNCIPFAAGACPEGETCTIVKSDGMTSCVPIGSGQACDPCPCDEGYMCNYSTGRCQKLCKTNMGDACTGGGTCQGILQGDIGVCIGGDYDCD